MIAKFNFYDVYGYFLPGLVWLTLLWLPLGMVSGRWPGGELVAALLAIPLAYVAGHILQVFAVRAIPSTSAGRFPSDLILDETDTTFSSDFKSKLAGRIEAAFGLKVYGDPSTASRQRNDALFLCRSTLIKAKTASYGEQFEGMYSLMRGLTLAFALGACHIAGWCSVFIAGLRTWAAALALGALCIAVAIEFWQSAPPARQSRKKAVASLVALAFALFSGGYALAADQSAGAKLRCLLFGLALIAVLLSRKCYQAYRSFTWEFAKAVYRDFATYEKPHGEEKSKSEE